MVHAHYCIFFFLLYLTPPAATAFAQCILWFWTFLMVFVSHGLVGVLCLHNHIRQLIVVYQKRLSLQQFHSIQPTIAYYTLTNQMIQISGIWPFIVFLVWFWTVWKNRTQRICILFHACLEWLNSIFRSTKWKRPDCVQLYIKQKQLYTIISSH